ncbi:hypothetical protein [Bremerella sp.]
MLADDFSGASKVAGIAYRYGMKTLIQTEWIPYEAECIIIDTVSR